MTSLAGLLRVAETGTLERLHDATLEILKETGVVFKSEEARAVFKEHGAKVDGEVVHISKQMLQHAIDSAPKGFNWIARDRTKSVYVGNGQATTRISPNNGPIFVQDLDGGRRPGGMEDLVRLYKLCQASLVCDVVGGVPVLPCEVPDNARHLMVFHELLRHTDKPLIGFMAPRNTVMDMFEMLEISMGKPGRLPEDPLIGVSINPLSPLRFDRESCETLLTYARFRQPVFVLSCAQAGVSSPSSLLGTAVMQNAEILSGLVLTQLVNPGTPFMYSPASAVPNMATAGYVTGSPESNMINIMDIQVAREIYNLPCRSMGGLTDAKEVDCQAGYETMQNLMMLAMAGVHLVNECLGVLDSIMTTSYEKFVIDEEIISRVLRIQKGVDVCDTAFSLDVIKEIGQTGSYLMHQATFESCRKSWRPTVSSWSSFADWEKKGKEDILRRANRKWKEILEKSPEKIIDRTVDKEIEDYVSRKLK